MIPYATPELFSQDSVEKQLVISFTGGSFTNSDIETESFEWNDPMCSAEQLEFGECCAASVKFNIGIDSVPMQGKELTITITPSGGTAVALGKFKVWSDVPTADRRWRTIEAYDAMADILNTECVSWYDGLFPVGTETYTVKQFRDSFFTFLGITQEAVTLINDSETVARTISATSLSGKDVITAICQMNAVFGKIARDGKFKYVDLVTFGETLYPAEDLYPADDLYPAENTNVTELGANGTYLSCEYEDYVTDFIDKVQIREQENDIGVIVGSGTNAFIIENNFLLFGKGSLVLTPIATAIYNHISGIYFKPAKMVTVGNPLMETGDGIRLWTKYAMIDTYILNRKMTGIQSLRDSIEAKSTKARAEELNDTHHELIQLIGKSNKLTRTIEEVESEIAQIETDLGDNYYTKTQTDSKIKQTADSIESTVSQSITQYDTETYTVTLYGFGAPDATIYPPASHSGAYYLDNTSGKLYLSDGSAWSVVKTLSLITTEQGTAISQNTSAISLKVGKGEVISSINQSAEQVTIDANRINLNGVVTANNNFKINLDGTMETIGATVNGEILSQEVDETDPNNPIILNQADLDDSVLTFSERMRTDTNESGTQQTYELLPLTEYYPNHITLRQYSYKYYANNYGYRDFPCYNTSDPHESEIYLVGPSYVARNASDWTYECLPILYIDGPERLYLRANNNVVIYSENITFPSSLKVRKRIQMYCGTQKVDMYDYDGSGSSYLYGSWVVQTGSDERIKKDIKNIEQKFIDAVGSIDLKQFVFKNRPEELDDKISLGVIAQDLIKALDAQGLDYKDYEVIGENDDRYFMVYDQFLVARCAYLEDKVSKLEERIARLEEIMEGDNK